jgi:excisionase family DNA binding protein
MVFSVKQAAEFLGCSQQAIYKMVYRKRLPHRRLGGKVIFLKKEIEQYLNQLPGLTVEEIE